MARYRGATIARAIWAVWSWSRFLTYLLKRTRLPLAALAGVPGSLVAPGGPVSIRIGRVERRFGSRAYGSRDRPSWGRPGVAFAMFRIVEVMSPFQTRARGCPPAGMPGPRISSGTLMEASYGANLPWWSRF